MSDIFKHPDFKVEGSSLKEKREKAIAYLGDKWLLAPVNYVQKKEKKK